MPSTATTNITIGTILDLIGAPSAIAGSDDNQSAFDTILQTVQPAPPPSPVASQNRRTSEDRSPPATKPTESANPANQNTNDSTGDRSAAAENNSSACPGSAPSDDKEQTDPAAEKSEDTQQLIAESLAGLPITAQPIPEVQPDASADESPTTDEQTLAGEKSQPLAGGSKKVSKLAARAAANPERSTETTATASNVEANERRAESRDEQFQAASNKDGSDVKTAFPAKATGEAEVVPHPADTETAAAVSHLESVSAVASSNDSEQKPSQDAAPTDETQPFKVEASSPAVPVIDPASRVGANTVPVAGPVVAAPPPNRSSASSQSASAGQANAVAAAGSRTRLPAQALAPTAGATTRRPAPEVDSARLLTRVVRAFSAAQERDGEVRLRLSPPELGALRLEIRVENGALTAQLQTETDSARTAIIDNLPVLRERLAEQGVRIERFDVDLMQRQPGGMPDQSGGRQPQTTEAPPRFLASSRTPNSTTPQPITSAPLVDRTSGLNVIV